MVIKTIGILCVVLLVNTGLAQSPPAGALVTYAGASGIEEFSDVMQLSDGTVLVAGSAENLDWITATKTQIAPLTIPNRVTGRTAFLMRIAADLQTILGVWHLPAGQALNFRWLKTTSKPGAPTGDLYLSGRCDASSGDYFFARLNNNFIAGNPTGFAWVKIAKATATYGDNLGLQPWDVGGDGRVAYVDETGETIRVFFLDAGGQPLKLAALRGSHWLTGATLDDANRQAGIGSDLPATTVSGISFPADLRSWTDVDRLAILPDGNGSIKRGTWPMDLFYAVQDQNGATSGTILYGYTGYRSVGKYRIGGVAFNRDSNDFSIGFNIQSRFWDGAAGIEQPDFEPAVISYAANGALKWWSRLYHEVVDANANGLIDSGETRLSSPDQYVDGLVVDHSTSPARLVVDARSHGNNVENLWEGNTVAASPGTNGFQNQFTGTDGNIHISWIAKLRDTDGTLLRSTYLAGYWRTNVLTQATYTEPIHDNWPSHNAGWPNITSTRVEPGSIRTDATGRVYVVGLGPRMVTTTNAYQKLPRITPSLDEGISPWAMYVRVFEPDLRTLAYSSALTGTWSYPSAGAQPVGADNTDLYGVFPSGAGVFAVGRQRATSGVPDGNPVPVIQIPAWGTFAPANVTALFAHLPFSGGTAPTNAPVITNNPVCTPSPVTGTAANVSALGAHPIYAEGMLIYTWSTVTTPAGGAVTFSPNAVNTAKQATATFTCAGNYTLKIVVTAPNARTAEATVNVSVTALPASISVTPTNAIVNPNGSNLFTAVVSDQFNQTLTNQPVTWSVAGGGTINSAGVFTAGGVMGGPFNVTAMSGSLTATARVSVAYVYLPDIHLPLNPLTQSMQASNSVTRPFRVQNLGSSNLVWTATAAIQGGGGGGNITNFQTSAQPGGPVYNWVDISSGATTLWAPTGSTQYDDNLASFNFPAGFSFPFYGGSFTSAQVCCNGFITFNTTNTLSPYSNGSLPTSSAPGNFIAAIWTDWLVDSNAWVKWKAVDADTLVITWNNILRYSQTNRASFQIVLKRSGDVVVQMLSYRPTDHTYTIGIQNAARNVAVSASYNPATNFIPTGASSQFAVRFPVPSSTPNWLSISPSAGNTAAAAATEATLTFNASQLATGSYNGTLTFTSNDPDEASVVVPVGLTVTPGANVPNAPTLLTASAISASRVDCSWQLEGGGAAGHRLQFKPVAVGVWTNASYLGAATTNSSAVGLAPGTAYDFRVVATNAAGDSPASNVASATTWTGLNQWRFDHWGSITNAGSAADTADPDGDSLINFVEYALGLDPDVFDVLPAPVLENDHLTWTYTRRVSTADVNYLVIASSSVTTGWSTNGIFDLVLGNNGVLQTNKAVDGATVSGNPQRFLQLQVIRP